MTEVLRRGSTHVVADMDCTDLWLDVPLVHDDPDSKQLTIYAREVVAHSGDGADDKPWLIFLQGGPGFGGPRPVDGGGWIGRAVRDYRVLLLDSRGNGRSDRLTAASIADLSPQQAADYVAAFRADSIVRDAELLRQALPGSPKWTVLGQSFGGFCLLTYMSRAPEGLTAALFTGGVPPMGATTDDVYHHTYARVVERNRRYHQRFPDDAQRWQRVADRVDRGDVHLPNGDRLSVRRLQLLGLQLGFEAGAVTLHHLVEEAFDSQRDELSLTFLKAVEQLQQFDTNPIFSVLHEAAYIDGCATDAATEATKWSAQRLRREYPVEADGTRAFPFTGEMIYPWMFEEIGALAPFAEVAEVLAERDDWPSLYDPKMLATNQVPAAAVIYDEDMYVERDLSLATASQVKNLQTWTTADYQHCALRTHGETIFDRLADMISQAPQQPTPSDETREL